MRELLKEVRNERLFQKHKWGDTHDEGHELDDWMRFIDERMRRLHEEDGMAIPHRRRRHLVQIAALAIAAVEALEARGG